LKQKKTKFLQFQLSHYHKY